ncbi:MAG: hypothetical protein P8N94_15655 [Gammaproteobacteria bacterium]|nr:hypothetical protein [Gammaproteobacteria bacterium]
MSEEKTEEEIRAEIEKQINEVASNLKVAHTDGVGMYIQAQVNLTESDVQMMVAPEHKLLPYLATRIIAENWRDHIQQFLEAAAAQVAAPEAEVVED